MNALLEFDEKEFWIQLFSVVARRVERTEDEDTAAIPAACAVSQPRDEAVAPRMRLGAQ